MITKDKDKSPKSAGSVPWIVAIFVDLIIILLVLLLIYGLVKLVKYFWLI